MTGSTPGARPGLGRVHAGQQRRLGDHVVPGAVREHQRRGHQDRDGCLVAGRRLGADGREAATTAGSARPTRTGPAPTARTARPCSCRPSSPRLRRRPSPARPPWAAACASRSRRTATAARRSPATRRAATSTNGGVARSVTAAASPITVTGLTIGRTYACRVRATNAVGTGRATARSGRAAWWPRARRLRRP